MPYKSNQARRAANLPHREALAEYARLMEMAFPGTGARRKREYSKKHPEKVKAWKLAYRIKNRELERKRSELWRLNNDNRLRANAVTRAWKSRNKERVYASVRKRQALEKGCALGDLEAIVRWQIKWKSRLFVTCYWCEKEFSPRQCQSDHIIPLSKGGPHELSNLCIACKPCNLRKSVKMPDEWKKLIAA
jgi:5-methylcytosine-specific restriction endonuclease McrA